MCISCLLFEPNKIIYKIFFKTANTILENIKMRHNINKLVGFLLIFLFVFNAPLSYPVARAQVVIDDAVGSWLENTGKELIRILALDNTEERHSSLRGMFRTDVDVDYIARKVIGRDWQEFDSNIRERYIKAFEDYMVYVYAAKPIEIDFQDFIVTRTRYLGSSAKVTIASAQANFVFPGGDVQQPRVLDFDFVLSKRDGNFKILDVSVGGFSVVDFVSSAYSSRLRQNNGDAYYMLRQLEKEVANVKLGKVDEASSIPSFSLFPGKMEETTNKQPVVNK